MRVAFTICSNNYLAKAQIAAETFTARHSYYRFFIFLVDKFIPEIDYKAISNAEVIAIENVVADMEELAKRYNIIELNTSVKPSIFKYLFKLYESDHIIYLDPDVMVFDRFLEIEDLFEKEDYNIIITPHFCSPIDDGKIPSDVHFSVFGLYNLGFIAVKYSTESKKFLEWWHERLMKYCYIDPANGMFTDQIWVNYAPIYFEGVHILKHMGYNVANWNLYEREIIRMNDTYCVNGSEKLKFFHFSHYKFSNPYLISDRQNRHVIDDFEYLPAIIDEYQSKLVSNNHAYYKKLPGYYHLIYKSRHREIQKMNRSFLNILRKAKNKIIAITKSSSGLKENRTI